MDTNSKNFAVPRSARFAACLLLAGGAAPAFGQLFSPQELALACETSPTNTVTLFQSTKVFLPSFPPPPVVNVASGCTIVLQNGAKLETEFVRLVFAGPLAIQSAFQTEIKLVKTQLQAPSVALNLSGSGSAYGASESNVRATAGALSLALGDESKAEIIGRLLTGPAMSGTSTVSVTAGRKFTGLIDEITIEGPLGVSIDMGSEEGLLNLTQVTARASLGNVAIVAAGAKSLLSASESVFAVGGGGGVTLRLAGNDSSIGMTQTRFDATGGNVVIEAGSDSAANGRIELSQISTGNLANPANFTVRGSASGLGGGLKLEKSRVSTDGAMRFETGASGTTEVKENTLTPGTLLRIATGPNGSCTGFPNVNWGEAPIVQICPAL